VGFFVIFSFFGVVGIAVDRYYREKELKRRREMPQTG